MAGVIWGRFVGDCCIRFSADGLLYRSTGRNFLGKWRNELWWNGVVRHYSTVLRGDGCRDLIERGGFDLPVFVGDDCRYENDRHATSMDDVFLLRCVSYEIKVCGWLCVMEFAMVIINKSDVGCDCVVGSGIGMIAPQVL